MQANSNDVISVKFWFPLGPSDITEDNNLTQEKKEELLGFLREFSDCRPEELEVAEAYNSQNLRGHYAVLGLSAGCRERFESFLREKNATYYVIDSLAADLIPVSRIERNRMLAESGEQIKSLDSETSSCVIS